MIEYRKGNLLDVTEGVILHGCNAQGVMGSGVALAVRWKYPQAYDKYLSFLNTNDGEVLGDIVWVKVSDTLCIANAITQQYYGRNNKRYVNYSALAKCFMEVIDTCAANYIKELHFPKIGAGLGGGDWNIIEQLINDCDPKDKVKKICWEL